MSSGLSNTAKPDANFQEFYKCEKVAQWCIVALMVSSLRTEAMLICPLFASSCSSETLKCTNGCHLQAVTTCSEVFYGHFIKICFYKNPVCLVKFSWWGFGCLCFHGISQLYLALLVSMQSCRNITFAFLCHLVKRDTYERPRSWAIKSSASSAPLHFRFLLLHCRRCSALVFIFLHLALIYYEYKDSVSASTAPASDLIPSRTVLRWRGPRVQTL